MRVVEVFFKFGDNRSIWREKNIADLNERREVKDKCQWFSVFWVLCYHVVWISSYVLSACFDFNFMGLYNIVSSLYLLIVIWFLLFWILYCFNPTCMLCFWLHCFYFVFCVIWKPALLALVFFLSNHASLHQQPLAIGTPVHHFRRKKIKNIARWFMRQIQSIRVVNIYVMLSQESNLRTYHSDFDKCFVSLYCRHPWSTLREKGSNYY